MKKIKPWVLTFATLTVASAAITAVATTCSGMMQNDQINIKTKQINNLPMPKAITNDQIKQDWKNYTILENKVAKVHAQHNYLQKISNSGEALIVLMNYNNSAKTPNSGVTHNDSEKIDTFRYASTPQYNNEFYNKWENVVKNAAESVRSKNATNSTNFTPLFTVRKQNNVTATHFIKFASNGAGAGGMTSISNSQYWVDPTKPDDKSMVNNLPNWKTIFGNISIHPSTATHALWGTHTYSNASENGIYQQSQSPDFVTNDNSKWTSIYNSLSNNAKNYNNNLAKNNLTITGDDKLYYNETHFGLPSNLSSSASTTRSSVEGKSTIRLYDGTSDIYKFFTHTSEKIGSGTGIFRQRSQQQWFEETGDIYGYNQNLKQGSGNSDTIDPILAKNISTDNTSITMDLDLANFISVQDLTNEKENGDVNTNNNKPRVKLGWNQTKMQEYKDKTLFAEYFSVLANHIKNIEFQRTVDVNSLANYYALATDIYNENIDVQQAYEIVNQITLNPENTNFHYDKAYAQNGNEEVVDATNLDAATKAIVSKTYGYNKVLPQFFSNDIYATIEHSNGSIKKVTTDVKIYDGWKKEWIPIDYDDTNGKPHQTFNNYVSTTIKDLKMVVGSLQNGVILANNSFRGLSGANIHNTWTTKDTQSNFKYNPTNHNASVDGNNGIKFTWKWNPDLNNKLFGDNNFATNGIKLDHTPSSIFDKNKQATHYVDKSMLVNKTKSSIGIDNINKNINENNSFIGSHHQGGKLNNSLTNSKTYYEKLQQAPSDLTQRNQEYYDAKKALDTQKKIHFSVDTDNVPLEYWFKEQTYKDATNNNVIDKKGSSSTEHFIQYKFDYDYLKLNNLENYMEVVQVGADWKVTFKLQDMKAEMGNWDALTTKAKVFDNNGLHEYFNETYETFWNKVIEIIKKKTNLNSIDLKPEHFKNDKFYTKSNNLYVHSKSNQTIDQIINDYDKNNYGQGGSTNKKGWEIPASTTINTLVYKFNAGTPKYQDGTNIFANRMSVNVTQQDQLSNAQTANSEYNTQKTKLENVKTEQEKIKTKVTDAETNLKNHLATIQKAQQDWNEYIDSVIGTNGSNKPGNADSQFKTKYNEIITNANSQIEQIKQDNIKTWNETMDKYNLETQTYRPFNWMWLVAQVEITQQQADKYNKEIGDKIKKVQDNTSQELTNLLALTDPNIKQEFQTKRDNLYKDLQSTLNGYKNTLTDLQTEVTKQKTKNTEVKTWMNSNKNYQDTIKATVDIDVTQGGVQLYKPTTINEDTQWISKNDRWWSMYNPNGQQDPTNTNNKTRYLVDKDELIKKLNKKIVDEIKKQDADFNVTLNNQNIISPDLIVNMAGVGTDEFDNGATIMLGSNQNQYKISPVLKYRLEAIPGTTDLKINSMKIEITAVNQFIKTTNEKINALKTQIDNNETSLNDSNTKVTNLLTSSSNHSVTKLEEFVKTITTSTIENDVAKKGVTYSWSHDFVPTKLEAMSFYHKKLNPLFLIVMLILLIVLLILLILLLVWLRRSNYRYRYTV